MKKVDCSYSKCGDYRVHHEKPDIARGQQKIEVPDDFIGKAYCSCTCAILDGAMSLRNNKQGARQEGSNPS
jgi:hypothetical protein